MKRLLLILFIASLAQAAQIIRYVDPDAPGPAHDGTSWNDAYLTLSAWELAEQTNLDGANNYMTVYCRSSSGTTDTAECVINGWTTSATDYIEIIGTDFPADGIYDDTKYVIHNNDDTTTAIRIQENYVRISNLQVLVTTTGGGIKIGIYANVGFAAADIRISNCIFKGIGSGTAGNTGVYINNAASSVLTIWNTVIYGFISTDNPGDNDFAGIYQHNGPTTNIYNCTVYGCYNGIQRNISGTLTTKNCAVGNNTDDFAGTLTIDYCASDDGDGTNAQAPSGGNWANEFTTPGTDFSLLVGGNCVENGTDNPSAGFYSDDIIGTARSSTWDIGAFEFVAAPGGSASQAIIIGGD